jgi:hypothetical protein
MNDVTYPSRIDAWLVVLVGGSVGIVLVLALASYSHTPSESLLTLGVLAATLLFSALVGYPCSYTLNDAQLVSPRERERFVDDLRRRVIAAGGRLMESRP